MNTEPTILLIHKIDCQEKTKHTASNIANKIYDGQKEKYLTQELLDGLCGSYRALNSKGETVFIKTFDRPKLTREFAYELYEKELRAAKDLSPLGVTLPVIDQGDQIPLIVQRFIHGRTLNELIKIAGPLKDRHAARILAPIAQKIKKAHATGYTHRDIKPDNIIYTEDDFELEEPIILDWGLSCHESERQNTAHCVGTPPYAAPEQFRITGIADERSDIYSLGIILHQLLTGKLPYGTTMTLQEITQKKEFAHNPRLIDPSANINLSLTTLKMTQPEKYDRHQNIDELLEDLKQPKMVPLR